MTLAPSTLVSRRPLITALMVVMLSACSTYGTPLEGMFGESTPPSCPDVRILAKAVSKTKFIDTSGRDVTDIDSEARLADFQALCVEDIDKDTGVGNVTVELTTAFQAARGPANTSGKAQFPYFVSLIDEERNIISKNVFEVAIGFERNAFKTTVFDEPVVLKIPISPPQRGSMFSIYIGMQLTEDDLQYNERIGASLLDG